MRGICAQFSQKMIDCGEFTFDFDGDPGRCVEHGTGKRQRLRQCVHKWPKTYALHNPLHMNESAYCRRDGEGGHGGGQGN